MKIPRKIDILGQTWTLRRTRLDDDGECSERKREIVLNKHLHEENEGEVFLHELIHAIHRTSGILHTCFDADCGKEENYTTLLAPLLYSVLVNNGIVFEKSKPKDLPSESDSD